MTTFETNTNDQDQIDFVASLDQCENDIFQNDSHFDIYDDSINYDDFDNILDIQERIEFSKVQAYFNEREIDQSQILKLDESLTNIQEKLEFDKVNAEFNISFEKIILRILNSLSFI